MKKYLFLTFCSGIIILGIYTTTISVPTEENNKIENKIQLDNTLARIEESTETNTKENKEVNIVNSKPDINKINKVDTISKTKIETVTNQKIKTPKQQTTSTQVSTYTEYTPKYSFLKITENISTENIKAVENEISRLPKKLIDTFYKTNWSISITNENMSDKYFDGAYSNVRGVTITGLNKIIIQNKISSIQTSVIHEYGHYLDWYFNYPSSSHEFKNIYNEEVNTFKSKIPNASCVRNEREFFAHTFYYSIKDTSKCTPKALNFVKTYVNELD